MIRKTALTFLIVKKPLQSGFQLYPLWLCPMYLPQEPGLVHPSTTVNEGEMYVDIGAYGRPQADQFAARKSVRNVEQFVGSVKG